MAETAANASIHFHKHAGGKEEARVKEALVQCCLALDAQLAELPQFQVLVHGWVDRMGGCRGDAEGLLDWDRGRVFPYEAGAADARDVHANDGTILLQSPPFPCVAAVDR